MLSLGTNSKWHTLPILSDSTKGLQRPAVQASTPVCLHTCIYMYIYNGLHIPESHLPSLDTCNPHVSISLDSVSPRLNYKQGALMNINEFMNIKVNVAVL